MDTKQQSNAEMAAVRQIFAQHVSLAEASAAVLAGAIVRAAGMVTEAYRNEGKVLLFGNGGSFSDALHIEGELTNRFRRDRAGLPAICLGAGQATLTATANDYSYTELFARLVQALGRRGDVAIGLTTSGQSQNVILALAAARERGLRTIAMTGKGGGLAAAHADVLIAVPSVDTARVQEIHILAGHIICQQVEDSLFPEPL
ncbi:MAG: SIS domain-containing protein [Planctomycetota bacterium]